MLQPPPLLLMGAQITYFADVTDSTSEISLRELILHPDWASVHSAFFPPTPPATPSPPASPPVVSDDAASNARRLSRRLSSRPSDVSYAQPLSDSDIVDPSPCAVPSVDPSLHGGIPPCVHKIHVEPRARGAARMTSHQSSSIPVAVPPVDPSPHGGIPPCVHKIPVEPRVRGTARMTCYVEPRVRKTARMMYLASDSDDDIPLHPGCNSTLALGTNFPAQNHLEAKEWLLETFKSVHTGGQIRCINSRSDYIYASCKKCGDARAAVTLKGHKWSVTTCKNGAEQACNYVGLLALPAAQIALPVAPVVLPVQDVVTFNEAEEVQQKVSCLVCFGDVTKYIACDAGHVSCLTCTDLAIEYQCVNSIQDFIRNRGVVCSMCRDSGWRLGFEEIKKRCLCTQNVIAGF